ncbi:putative uncharacterized protein [Clostridium sp. CAG:524]|nr:putative uncharacterized protein [Clostridium sp. CAG:524]
MYDIDRFIKMQELYYEIALSEIKDGYKRTHWIWYIFPQLKGLGQSYNSEYYGLDSVDEVIEYMKNPYLRNNMIEICNELYKLDDSIENIFGYPDYLKLNSCMTLFEYSIQGEKIFGKIIDKFYNGKRDRVTLEMLEKS